MFAGCRHQRIVALALVLAVGINVATGNDCCSWWTCVDCKMYGRDPNSSVGKVLSTSTTTTTFPENYTTPENYSTTTTSLNNGRHPPAPVVVTSNATTADNSTTIAVNSTTAVVTTTTTTSNINATPGPTFLPNGRPAPGTNYSGYPKWLYSPSPAPMHNNGTTNVTNSSRRILAEQDKSTTTVGTAAKEGYWHWMYSSLRRLFRL